MPLMVIVCPQIYTILLFLSTGLSACRLDIHGNISSNAQLNVTCDDVIQGKFSIIESHPEALLETPVGQTLLDSESFVDKVKALVIDECHMTEQWLVIFLHDQLKRKISLGP